MAAMAHFTQVRAVYHTHHREPELTTSRPSITCRGTNKPPTRFLIRAMSAGKRELRVSRFSTPNGALTLMSTFSRRLQIQLRILVPVVLLTLQFQFPIGTSAQTTQAHKQHFVCNSGYTPQECLAAMTVLRKALAKYPVGGLGEWTWVLVRSVDWKRILLERGFDPNNPAFSYLPRRETFFDSSLVMKVSARGVELSAQWHMPIEDLLDLAIRHELAHALCNETNEAKADGLAIALKSGATLSCQTTLLFAHEQPKLIPQRN